VQFGDDWPGLFLRGKVALHYSLQLSHLLIAPSQSQIAISVLRGLLSDLRSVEVGKGAPVQQLKFYEECVRPPPQGTTEVYYCDRCEREPDGRHRAKCPRSAESMLQRVQELIDAVPSPEGKVALGWVVQAASAFEKIRDLPGWER
jgi:hypothetical protein